MSTTKQPNLETPEATARAKSLGLLAELRDRIETWARQSDWSTRRIEKTIHDSSESYSAPGLLLQKEFCRILLDPLDGGSADDEAAADLYRMPEYDDVARLYFSGGQWHMHFMFPGAGVTPEISDASSPPLSQKLLIEALQAMSQHAA